MAITTTGWNGTGDPNPNTCKISLTSGDLLSDMIAAIEAFLTTHNWALYDAAAGTNARAYRCQALPDSQGAIHYGHIVLDYNTSGYLLLKHYESWNAVTHTGTNLAYSSGDTTLYSQRFPANSAGVFTASGWLRIHASKFGIVLVGNDGNSTGTTGDSGPTFVFQLSRTCPEDTAALGFSKWVWGCTYKLGSGNIYQAFSPTRTRWTTGINAQNGAFTDFGATGLIGNAIVSQNNCIMPARVDFLTGKLNYSNIRVVGAFGTATYAETLGTVLDLIAVTSSQGTPNTDDITFNADNDADFGGAAFTHANAAPQTWWLIGGTAIRLAIRK